MYDESHNLPGSEGTADAPAENIPTTENDFGPPEDFGVVGIGESAAGRPRANKATMALIGLLIAGAAAVAILSVRSGPISASASDQAAEKKVDTYIAGSPQIAETAKNFQNTKKVVDKFYHYASRHQVPVDELNTNPFVFGDKDADADPSDDASDQTGEATRLAGKRRAELRAEFAKLKLQSVMMGPRGGTAIINGNFVAEGHVIGSFTVAKILPRQVRLIGSGLNFTLPVGE
ncbi:MAG: hypothetical protein HQ546_06225 [Planctomycetes bacterium]|nr:hypothetical protein [Planctomycetota bacterium]